MSKAELERRKLREMSRLLLGYETEDREEIEYRLENPLPVGEEWGVVRVAKEMLNKRYENEMELERDLKRLKSAILWALWD